MIAQLPNKELTPHCRRPEDELSWNPKDGVQTYRSWLRLKERNKLTPERRTVYFVGPPDLGPGLEHVKKWAEPILKGATKEKPVPFPKTEEVLDYLKVFYHGLPVKMLTTPKLQFSVDDEVLKAKPKGAKKKGGKKTKTETLWLNTKAGMESIGIQTRATPDGTFSHQLNLNDLLDAAIDMLPDDAYALLMLVEHDIFEDEEDDFACGRAYGGSRIAVVSGARYNPILDIDQGIEREHSWPASHCEKYMMDCCAAAVDEDDVPKKKAKSTKAKISKPSPAEIQSPMYSALEAHKSLPSLDKIPSSKALSGLWLGRTARTAGHELGHCFGIGHCTTYACSMQGTASIIEDARQPPYLCPIDLVKVLTATEVEEADRDKAILGFCDRYKETHLFASYAAWIRSKNESVTVIDLTSD